MWVNMIGRKTGRMVQDRITEKANVETDIQTYRHIQTDRQSFVC